VGKAGEQDHGREQTNEYRLRDDVVQALVKEHDDSCDDARAAGHERDASRALAS
jgi:hypothetical protein